MKRSQLMRSAFLRHLLLAWLLAAPALAAHAAAPGVDPALLAPLAGDDTDARRRPSPPWASSPARARPPAAGAGQRPAVCAAGRPRADRRRQGPGHRSGHRRGPGAAGRGVLHRHQQPAAARDRGGAGRLAAVLRQPAGTAGRRPPPATDRRSRPPAAAGEGAGRRKRPGRARRAGNRAGQSRTQERRPRGAAPRGRPARPHRQRRFPADAGGADATAGRRLRRTGRRRARRRRQRAQAHRPPPGHHRVGGQPVLRSQPGQRSCCSRRWAWRSPTACWG